jgi:lycopene cyclase domain-containing protein
MEYLLIEILFLSIIIFIHKYNKIKIFKNKVQTILFWFIIFIIGVVWDNYAVFRGHWFYPGNGLIGPFLGYLPIEDYIFIGIIPYGVLVIYKALSKYKKITSK